MMNKDQWIALFQDVGLSEETMHRWHHLFETRHPEAHQSFLEWLGIPPEAIGQIRERSR